MAEQKKHFWFFLKKEKSNSLETDSNFLIKIPKQYNHLFTKPHHLIEYGDIKLEAKINVSDISYNDKIFICSEELFTALQIPNSYTIISAFYCKNSQQITIGPILGIITDTRTKLVEHFQFPLLQKFCEEMAIYSSQLGLPFFIYFWKQSMHNHLYGYYYDKERWNKNTISLKPNFLYNRIHSRIISYSREFQEFMENSKQQVIHIYNTRFISKEDLYTFTENHKTLNAYIPEGAPFTKEDFSRLIHQFHIVFIKPNFGSQGRGIIRAELKDGIIQIEQLNSFTKSFTSLDDAWDELEKQTKGRAYWLQRGLRLANFENRKIDFRILTHLNPDGKWKITSLTARLSEPDSFVTNLSQGGALHTAKSPLTTIFGKEKAVYTLQLMEELALTIAEIINQSSESSFIELGIDIGVTTEGKVYLIEVNSKPSKATTDHSNVIRPSAKAITHIAASISKQSMEEGCKCNHLES